MTDDQRCKRARLGSSTHRLELVSARKPLYGDSRESLGIYRVAERITTATIMKKVIPDMSARARIGVTSDNLGLTGSGDGLTGGDRGSTKDDTEGSFEVDIVLGQETGDQAGLYQ